VVIRAYNEKPISHACSSNHPSTVREVEIIPSTRVPRMRLWLSPRAIPCVVSIDPAGFSFSRSLNLGCAAARRDIVVASAHVYPVYDDWLAQLLSLCRQAGGSRLRQQRGDSTTRFSEHESFGNGSRRDLYLTSRPPSATMPTPPSAGAYGESVATTRISRLGGRRVATWAQAQGYLVCYRAEAKSFTCTTRPAQYSIAIGVKRWG
jgi:hypothetical protein